MSVRAWQETLLGAYPNLGGLYDAPHPALVPTTGLVQADNIIFSDRLTWKKRGGLVQQNSASMAAEATVRMLVDYWRAGSSGAPSQKLVAVCGTHFYKDDLDNTWDDISGSVSCPRDSIVTSAVVGDSLVMAFSATVPMVWNQTGNVAALGGTPPNGNIVAQHLNRCWMNEKTDPHRIYYTGVNSDGSASPSRWSSANGGGSFAVEDDDGDPVGITAMFQLNDNLYVAKLTKLYRIEGRTTSSFSVVPVINGIGCVSHNMAVSIGNDAIFPSLRGFHSLALVAQTGQIAQETFVSNNIHRAYINDINHAKIKYGHGKFHPLINSIVWCIPQSGDTTNNTAYVFSLTTKQWTRFTNFRGNALMTKLDAANRVIELWTGGTGGQVYKYKQFTRNDYGSEPISMIAKSGHIHPDKRFAHLFAFKEMNLLTTPSGNHEVDFRFRTDTMKNSSGNLVTTSATYNQGAVAGYAPLGSGSFMLSDTLLGSDSFIPPLTIPMQGEGRAIQWTVKNDKLNQDLEIAGWYLEVEETGIRRNRY